MLISVALNGSKRRDLSFWAGDEQTLTLAVYALDGDTATVAVTDPRIIVCPSSTITIPVTTQFVVPDECCGRAWYRLVAEVAGVTTTLAYGLMMTSGGDACCSWRWDYGGPWGWGCCW